MRTRFDIFLECMPGLKVDFLVILLSGEPKDLIPVVLKTVHLLLISLVAVRELVDGSINVDRKEMVLVVEIRPRMAFRHKLLGMRRKAKVVVLQELEPLLALLDGEWR